MKLKVFNSVTVPKVNTKGRVGFISVYFKSGVFSINKPAAAHLGLKENNQVQLLQNEDEPQNWYLEKVTSNGFVLRSSKDSGALLFNSCPMAAELRAAVNCKNKSGRILIGERVTALKGRNVYELVTAALNAYRGE